jgi:hypothetical protein
VKRFQETHVAQVAIVAAASAVVSVSYVAVTSGSSQPTGRPSTNAAAASHALDSQLVQATVALDDLPPCPSSIAAIIDSVRENCPVQMTATVLDVPADEGFCIGVDADGPRLWVHLIGASESPQHVLPGDSVELRGTVQTHPFTGDSSDSEAVQQERASHLDVDYADLVITSRAATAQGSNE